MMNWGHPFLNQLISIRRAKKLRDPLYSFKFTSSQSSIKRRKYQYVSNDHL